MKQFLLLFSFCFLGPLLVSGSDCMVDVPTTSGGLMCVTKDGFIGQAFVPCQSGKMTSLSFNIPFFNGTGSYKVYVTDGKVADKTLPSTQIYGPFTSSGVVSVEPNRFVKEGKEMIFWVEFTGFSRVCFDGSNNFNYTAVHSGLVGSGHAPSSMAAASSGSLITTPTGTGGHTALAFNANIERVPIPSLSEWGLVIFGLLTINLGIFFVQKKEEVIL